MSKRAEYLQSLKSVRETCTQVFTLAESNSLDYWNVDLNQETAIVDFCCELISRDFGTNYDDIPPHGRWRHFLANGNDRIQPLLDEWRQTTAPIEIARRLIDLFVVSVLLDAGAGPDWKYREHGDNMGIGRSEGLAVASLDMVKQGLFSGIADLQPFRVDAQGLSQVTVDDIKSAMQVSESNPMVGIEGRAGLLVRLGTVLNDPKNAKYFASSEADEGQGLPRPGNIVDYIRAHPSATLIPSPSSLPISVPLEVLWDILIHGLGGVWPASRSKLDGMALGDVWPCESLRKTVDEESKALVSFHKLTQWLNYSLLEVFDKILGWKFTNVEYATGLPEYRNGGLLVDFGLLTIKSEAILQSFGKTGNAQVPALQLPPLPASHSAIVEFRAVTVIMLDRIGAAVNKKLGADLVLAQVLESATWKGGREIAKKKRQDGGPPINVLLDGTVF